MATTRPGQQGTGVRPYAGFSPKSPASGSKSSATVTRLLSIGIGGRRRKTGIGGKRVSFQPKSGVTGDTLGGSKTVKELTQEQIDNLTEFGKIQMGIEEITNPVIPEIPILPDKIDIPDGIEIPLSELVLESQVERDIYEPTLQQKIETEDDIGLLLAIITAHES